MSDFDFFFETRVRAAYEKGFTGPFNMEAVEAVLECFVGHAEKWGTLFDGAGTSRMRFVF